MSLQHGPSELGSPEGRCSSCLPTVLPSGCRLTCLPGNWDRPVPQARECLGRCWPCPTTACPRPLSADGVGAQTTPLTAALVLPDKPTALQPRDAHLPSPQLWLPPQGLLGYPVPQAVLWGAHLPLEAERGQAGLREPAAGLPRTTAQPRPALCQGGASSAGARPVLCGRCCMLPNTAGPAITPWAWRSLGVSRCGGGQPSWPHSITGTACLETRFPPAAVTTVASTAAPGVQSTAPCPPCVPRSRGPGP